MPLPKLDEIALIDDEGTEFIISYDTLTKKISINQNPGGSISCFLKDVPKFREMITLFLERI